MYQTREILQNHETKNRSHSQSPVSCFVVLYLTGGEISGFFSRLNINSQLMDIKEAVNYACEEVVGRRKPEHKEWPSAET